MRLSKPSILREIEQGRLQFTPALDPIQVTASSVDLRLGNRFIRLDRRIALQRGIGADIRFDVGSANWEQLVEAYGETTEVPDGEPFELDRNRLVLGWTKEYIRLPETLAGRVEGKSKPARLGLLVHVTAPTLQVGWEGNLQLEFFNVGPAALLLRPGILICQIILEQVTDPLTYQGQFQAQRS